MTARADGKPSDQPTHQTGTATAAALTMDDVTAGYRYTTVLRGVDLTVQAGSVVALLGPNGAGKTTLLRTFAGMLQPSRGKVLIAGTDVTRQAPHRRTRCGLCLIPEGRGIFPALTVRENLRMQVPPWSDERDAVEIAVAAFPILGQRLSQVAGTMSGGQQQMLALSRAWNSGPQVVMLDEVSMGLAPLIVDEIFAALRDLAASGVALLIVEQYVNRVLDIANDVYLLEKGSISFHGAPTELDQAVLLSGYLGADETVRTDAD